MPDKLVLAIYHATRCFPSDELFGLTAQIRRAAVSVPSNIVEGCPRRSEADYLHFLDMAYGSARELGYQVGRADRLGFLADEDFPSLDAQCVETGKVLNGLIRSIRNGS